MTFSNVRRGSLVNKMKNVRFDCLVIGAGITGAGIALDAVTRGMKVALVDMQDFAAGTSSRSTKLIHGGLRYLKHGEFKMVREVGRERQVVFENGPHVTKAEWMLLPIYTRGTLGKYITSLGLMLYDFLADVKDSERRIMLNKAETLQKVPFLKQEGLLGGGYYVEYRTDDARLTIEVLKAAVEKGAVALNYTKVAKLLFKNNQVIGVQIKDQLTGEQYEVYATVVINATGPWIDAVSRLDRTVKSKALQLTKGVHIVLNQAKLPLTQAVYFEIEDRRMVFAIPRAKKVYVGTTDTIYKANPLNVTVSSADRSYLLKAINEIFPSIAVTEKDIESSWAGVRPLIFEEGKDPSEISRKDEVWESPGGLISIAGGKLTGYRKMAEKVVDIIAYKLQKTCNRQYPRCRTKYLKISGGNVGGADQFPLFVTNLLPTVKNLGLTEVEARELICLYGSNVYRVLALMEDRKQEAEEFQLPLALFGKLEYGIEYEMVATPLDFFYRRTGDLLFDIHSVIKWKDSVIAYMAKKFIWTPEIQNRYRQELLKTIAEHTNIPFQN